MLRAVRSAVAQAVADVVHPAARVGVACSGGADSVALADAAVAVLGPSRVVLLHVDHRLHPGSAAVVEHVRALAGTLGCAFDVSAVTVGAGASLEEQARIARYAALEEAAERLDLACVLTAHTARDQAETVLLRIVRGTGPAGLAGIPRVRGVHRRPLLDLTRAEILEYVAARELPAVDDPMNADPRFARVRARATLMPALAAENPRVEEALTRLARAAAEWTELVEARATDLLASARVDGARTTLAVRDVVGAGPAVAKRALQRLVPGLAADHLEAAWHLASSSLHGSRSLDLPGAQLARVYEDLVVSRGPAEARTRRPLVVEGPDGPYLVRAWEPGDRMRPARLRGRSRKLSDLYTDAKVPRAEREGARVVVDRTGAIVWAEHVGAALGARIRVLDEDESP